MRDWWADTGNKNFALEIATHKIIFWYFNYGFGKEKVIKKIIIEKISKVDAKFYFLYLILKLTLFRAKETKS